MCTDSTVCLIALGGELVHTWCMPYPPLSGYLTDRGTLVYNGSIEGSTPRNGGVVLEVDWAGEVIWEVRHPDHHDDGIRLSNGNPLLLCLAEIPCESGQEDSRRQYADYLVEMTTDGRTVWEWRSWEHLEPGELANSLVELANGAVMLGFRLTSKMVIVQRAGGVVVSTVCPPIANAQRLWNGNTLTNEGATGRLFEMTEAGEIVWEYINPYFCRPTARAQTNAILRAYRYPADQIANAMPSTE